MWEGSTKTLLSVFHVRIMFERLAKSFFFSSKIVEPCRFLKSTQTPQTEFSERGKPTLPRHSHETKAPPSFREVFLLLLSFLSVQDFIYAFFLVRVIYEPGVFLWLVWRQGRFLFHLLLHQHPLVRLLSPFAQCRLASLAD